MPRPAVRLVDTAIAIAVAVTSAMVLATSLPYFTADGPFAFLVEKGALADWPPWRVAFVVHVGASMLCLAIGPLMFSRTVQLRAPAVHRLAGRGYAVAALALAGPTGLFLAVFAKGGLPGRAGFLLLGALWLWTTWQGVRAALARNIPGHAAWMTYSWALAVSAPGSA